MDFGRLYSNRRIALYAIPVLLIILVLYSTDYSRTQICDPPAGEIYPQPEPVPRFGRKRIAVMLVGGTRTLVQRGVYTSFLPYVRDALAGYGADTADMFLFLANDAQANYAHNYNRAYPPATAEQLAELKAALRPVLTVVWNDTTCHTPLFPELSSPPHPCCAIGSLRDIAGFLQYWFIRAAWREVRDWEEQHNVTYDWYFRIRPDVACFEPLPAVRSLSPRRWYAISKEMALEDPTANLNDFLFLVPRALAEAFFERQLLGFIEESCNAVRGVPWPPEQFAFGWPSPAEHLPYTVYPFPCVCVRGPRLADCQRLTRGPANPSPYTIDGTLFDTGETWDKACFRLLQEGFFDGVDHTDTPPP